MSSNSTSGSSPTTGSDVRPDASRSNRSVTRVRRPRTQGRPAHWSGLTVIRSASAATVALSFAKSRPAAGWVASLLVGRENWRVLGIIFVFFRALALPCRGHRELVLENLALRQQLNAFKRRGGRPPLRT